MKLFCVYYYKLEGPQEVKILCLHTSSYYDFSRAALLQGHTGRQAPTQFEHRSLEGNLIVPHVKN